MGVVCRAFAAVCVLAGTMGCGDATQVVVVFEADAEMAMAATAIRVTRWTQERERRVETYPLGAEANGGGVLLRVPISPRGDDATRRMEVSGELLGPSDEVIAEQRRALGFEEGAIREVTVRFTADCAGVFCGPFRTCRDGGCVGACVSAEQGAATECPETACGGALGQRLFCDGFEATLAEAWETQLVDRGSIQRVAQPAFRGRGALQVRIDGGEGANAIVRTGALNHLERGDVFFRTYLFVPSGQELTTLNTVFLGSQPNKEGFQIVLRDTNELATRIKPEDATYGVGPVPLDAWTCIEVHSFMDATDGLVEVWVDGERKEAISGIASLPTGGVQQLDVGVTWTPPEQITPATFYLDEVVADTERIGCDSR